MQPQYTISTHGERPIPGEAVKRLYDAANFWPERSTADIKAMLSTGPAVGAWFGNELIGFARAVSDGRFRAYIEDVVVSPPHRRRGVASALMRVLIGELADIDVVSLFCDQSLAVLYSRAGFKATKQRVFHRKGTHETMPG